MKNDFNFASDRIKGQRNPPSDTFLKAVSIPNSEAKWLWPADVLLWANGHGPKFLRQ